jgi:cell shape-determining protein MreD
MRRTAVLFLTLLLLWALVAEVNHALSPAHVWLFAGGLFVTYAALALPRAPGLAAVILCGCVFDAHAPVAFGTHAVLFAIAYLLIHNARDRLPRNEAGGRVLIALAANFGLFIALSFACARRAPAPGSEWGRLLGDLVCSQVFIALIARWFFALQARALKLAAAA